MPWPFIARKKSPKKKLAEPTVMPANRQRLRPLVRLRKGSYARPPVSVALPVSGLALYILLHFPWLCVYYRLSLPDLEAL